VKNLVYWAPPIGNLQDVKSMVSRARLETTGRADVILLDIDAALLEHSGGFSTGVDYVVAVTEATDAGQLAAEKIAERLGDAPPPHGRVGVCFSRIDAPAASELPERTSRHSVPVVGYYPADYLLANGEDYSLKGGETSPPHDTYLFATLRLGQKLIQLVPLVKVSNLATARNTLATHE
jgi:CO dehydrogenase nickel-insertion accessory protein CooC1